MCVCLCMCVYIYLYVYVSEYIWISTFAYIIFANLLYLLLRAYKTMSYNNLLITYSL